MLGLQSSAESLVDTKGRVFCCSCKLSGENRGLLCPRKFIDGLVAYCLQSPGFKYFSHNEKYQLAGELREYLFQAVLETLVNRLDTAQFNQIEKLDPARPEMVAKVQQLVNQIPGLASDIESRLLQDALYIHQNSKIPA